MTKVDLSKSGHKLHSFKNQSMGKIWAFDLKLEYKKNQNYKVKKRISKGLKIFDFKVLKTLYLANLRIQRSML